MKNLMVLCDEAKKKDLMELMKTIENGVVKAMEINVEEI
jgi:UDP-N-acetylenolpyruvoylglucosamine reductase